MVPLLASACSSIPTAEILSVSGTHEADLFWGAASACGTSGVVTLFEVQLRAAWKYVQLAYHPSPSIPEATTKLEEESRKENIPLHPRYRLLHGLNPSSAPVA